MKQANVVTWALTARLSMTTSEHPFYTAEGKWAPAGGLLKASSERRVS